VKELEMSFVIASPDVLASASSDLAGIGSAIREANAAAAGSTTSVVAAGVLRGDGKAAFRQINTALDSHLAKKISAAIGGNTEHIACG
jgi:hypothetical protein